MPFEPNSPLLSIILPCQNEAESLASCLLKIKDVIDKNRLSAEIIVSDSSTDNSPQIAQNLGVKLIKHDKNGYGRAYLEAFKIARGQYLFCADADCTYDFNEIPRFINYLEQGYDLVIGNRFDGHIHPHAMPWLHHYIGNPLLSSLFNLFFKTHLQDIHSGMRALRRSALERLNLKTTGMEFASEMIISANLHRLKIKELPIDYYPRLGKSKLKSFPDGWRHLRFMLIYAPNYLFLIPGFLFFLFGLILIFIFPANLIYGCFLIILGYQIINLGLYSKTYLKFQGSISNDKFVDFLAQHIRFESGILWGLFFLLITLLIKQKLIFNWLIDNSSLTSHSIIILALTLAVLGIQTLFSAFLISILLIEKNEK